MKLAKASVPYRALRDLGTLLTVFLFSGNLSFRTFDLGFVVMGALGVVLVAGVSLLWEYIVWSRYDYFFEEDSLRISHGVFRKREREIPYRRVQNVNLKKNILHRVLGIAKADFETAGGSGTEASLKYVTVDQGRDIQERVRRFRSGDVGEEDSDKESVFELSGRDLVAYSFLSVDARSVGLALAGFGVFAGVLAGVMESFSLGPVVGFSLLGVLLLGGTWVLSAASNFVKFYGFRLWRRDDTLEYEYGLLNRSEGSVPEEKVQGISMEENFLKRLFGFASLKLETAGVSDEQQVQSDVTAVPLAERSEVLDFARMIESFEGLDLNGVPSRARRRYFGRYLIGISGLLVAGFLVDSVLFGVPYMAVLLFVPLAAAGAHLKWRNRGWELHEDHFVNMNGFWQRRVDVTPYYRVQNVIQTETVFQRRWDLSSVTMDTAGDVMSSDARAVDLDVTDAVELREELFERFKRSLDTS